VNKLRYKGTPPEPGSLMLLSGGVLIGGGTGGGKDDPPLGVGEICPAGVNNGPSLGLLLFTFTDPGVSEATGG